MFGQHRLHTLFLRRFVVIPQCQLGNSSEQMLMYSSSDTLPTLNATCSPAEERVEGFSFL